MRKEKERLKIGMLHYSSPPIVGGVEQILEQHTTILQRLGQEVHLLAGMGGPYAEDVQVRLEPLVGSRDAQIRKANNLSKKGDDSLTRSISRHILDLLLDWGHGLNVILAHNVLHMPYNLPLTWAVIDLAGRKDAPPVVSWVHDSPYTRSSPPGYLFESPWDCLRERQAGVHYVTVSDTRKALFERHLGDFDWTVIHNGIDPDGFFYLAPKTLRLAKELRLFDRDLVVVQPARITPRKNQELAISIIHGLKEMGHDVLFIIPGAYDPHEPRATAYYRKLMKLVRELGLEDNVAILAEYAFHDGERLVADRIFIRDLYLVADLLLMTSMDEGFGLPLLEAGMAKLPIACTDLPIFREIAADVCFIRHEDPPLFSSGRIIEYLSRTQPHRMFRNVMENYIWDTICDQELLPFLNRIVASN